MALLESIKIEISPGLIDLSKQKSSSLILRIDTQYPLLQ
jgi:hypothetical protein